MTHKRQFCRHRAVIVLICLALLVLLMQGASWFSRSNQAARSPQVDELARTLARQVAFSLQPLIAHSRDNGTQINAILRHLTENSRIPDASLYDDNGVLIAHSGETINVRHRLALEGKHTDSPFTHQIIEPLPGSNGPVGFLRITLDTHMLMKENRQIEKTTNALRIQLLLALAIGIILTCTLMNRSHTHWQRPSFPLTSGASSNKTLPEKSGETPAPDKQ